MKSTTTFFFIALIVAATALRAQDATTTMWLTDSSRAIQFGVSGNFTLGTFDGKSISFKQHLTDKRAIRIGVSFSGSINKQSSSDESFQNDTLLFRSNTSFPSTHALGLEISTHYLWYMPTADGIFLYCGAGPRGSYSRSENVGTTSSEKSESWTAGACGAAGVEWFIHKRFALHAEYQGYAQYAYTCSSSSYSGTNSSGKYFHSTNSCRNTWNLSSQKVVFGISVYF
jgi:hypothetical protein